MKPKLSSPYSKTIGLIASVSLQFAGLSAVEAGSRSELHMGAVGLALHNNTKPLSQGYLLVYSATDPFDDGGVVYNPHSSYSIYRSNGTLFKSVANHIAPSDDSPELVTLPAGSYTIDVRSEKNGYVRVPVVIAPFRRTLLALDR